jgi:hypothetical protein
LLPFVCVALPEWLTGSPAATGGILADDRQEEFSEDHLFPIQDLLASSPRSEHDQLFTYRLDDVSRISKDLGIVWHVIKDRDFATEFPYAGYLAYRTFSLQIQPAPETLTSLRPQLLTRFYHSALPHTCSSHLIVPCCLCIAAFFPFITNVLSHRFTT